MAVPEVARENRRWLEELAAQGSRREAACSRLYEVLLRVARAEVLRRAPALRLVGPELEDLAHQAAADALMSITDRLDRFRGESRFTTWAIKFVLFDVAGKMNRHHWQRFDVPYEHEDWARLASTSDVAPDEAVHTREFAGAVMEAVGRTLSERQRVVFIAVVVQQTPIGVLAERLESTSNALYKVLFDARTKLRAAMVEAGHLPMAEPRDPRGRSVDLAHHERSLPVPYTNEGVPNP